MKTSHEKFDQKGSTDIRDYITVKQLTAENAAFTEGGIRSLIFNAHKNGFGFCIRRIGRRILISRTAFANWIESQNKGGCYENF
jgi:hypothetical protein